MYRFIVTAMEMIDIEKHDELIDYLAASGLLAGRSQPVCTNLLGGVSNRTVKISFTDGTGWVVKQALAKLRVASDWYADPKRIHVEAEGLRWLARLLGCDAVPAFIHEDHQQQLFIMTAIAEPHHNYKHLLFEHPPESQHAVAFGRMLATLHNHAYEQREELLAVFADTSFFEHLRLDPYYRHSARQFPDAAPFLYQLILDTRQRRRTLVHGDYSPKNILIHDNRLVLLDHEVIHFGDPAFDVGFSLAHFLSKAHARKPLRDEFLDVTEQYWHTYRSHCVKSPWADDLESLCIRHTIACLLARVAGKSMLEYLTNEQRAVQKIVVKHLIDEPPLSLAQLIRQFPTLVHTYE
jgi:aminoglycoside phosphotransferase (APT) family kinase protein